MFEEEVEDQDNGLKETIVDLESLYEDKDAQEEEEKDEDGEEEDGDAEGEEVSVVESFLKEHGVDPNDIRFEGEDKGYSFDELSDDDKLLIFQELYEKSSQPAFNEEDLELLSFARDNNTTLADMIEERALELARELENDSVTAMTDDEVYVEALKSQYPDLDEDELQEELESAKSRSNFPKKVEAIRNQMVEIRKMEEQQEQEQVNMQRRQELNELKNSFIKAAVETESLHGFEFDKDTRNLLLSQLVEFDENGDSELEKALSNPQNVIKAAWYLNYGELAFQKMHEVYQKQISEAYAKGKREGQQGLSSSPISKGTGTTRKSVAPKQVKTLEELYND